MAKNNGFNCPFTSLKNVEIKQEKPAKPQQPAGDGSKQAQKRQQTDESRAFWQAMAGVTRLSNDKIANEPVAGAGKSPRQAVKDERPDQSVMAELNDLVSGQRSFKLTNSGEQIEGHLVPIDPQTFAKLKQGRFAIEERLDLHGHDRESARSAVTICLRNAYAMGERCVLIIPGRGLSSTGEPVIKQQLVKWLTHDPLAGMVLAFCSARPAHGGTGAVYVLLKKRAGKNQGGLPD